MEYVVFRRKLLTLQYPYTSESTLFVLCRIFNYGEFAIIRLITTEKITRFFRVTDEISSLYSQLNIKKPGATVSSGLLYIIVYSGKSFSAFLVVFTAGTVVAFAARAVIALSAGTVISFTAGTIATGGALTLDISFRLFLKGAHRETVFACLLVYFEKLDLNCVALLDS